MNTEALSLNCSLLGAVGHQEREPVASGFAAPDVGCTLGFWGAKPDVLQLDCAVSDPEMSRAVPCCSAVVAVEPQKGPDGHKSQGQAVLG